MSKKKLKKKIKNIDKCLLNLNRMLKLHKKLHRKLIMNIPTSHWNKQF